MMSYDEPAYPRQHRSILFSLVGAVLISAVLAVGALTLAGPERTAQLVGLITTLTPSPTRTPKPSRTPTASLTVPPSDTPRPSATPPPTDTPRPSATPPPSDTPRPTDTPTPTPTFTPWPTPDDVQRSARVPILMYHHIAVPPPEADVYERDLSVLPEDFAAQLAYLRDNGYTAVTLYDLQYALALGWPLPAKPVVITFDDGYVDAYTAAYPLLKQYGFSGTFFIVTDFVDDQYVPYMSWEQIEAMAADGMDMEPHSRNHADLRHRDRDYLVWQILGSRETLAAHIGHQPRFFAYPSGRYDGAVIEILKEANFWGSVSTEGGLTHTLDDMFTLTRVRVRGGESLATFASTIP